MDSQNQKTILLVEDEVILTLGGKADLQKNGHKAILAHTGKKPLREL